MEIYGQLLLILVVSLNIGKYRTEKLWVKNNIMD